MGLVTLPNALTDGTTARGSEVYANDAAIRNVVNGNIDDSNISVTAAIDARKLSTVAGHLVDAARIEDDAVTADKLRDDASVDANRSVTTNHVRDGAITKAKVSTTSKLALSNLDITVQEVSFSISISPGVAASVSSTDDEFTGFSLIRFTSGGNYNFRVTASNQDVATITATGCLGYVTVTPTTNIPVASSTVISAYVADLVRISVTFAAGIPSINYSAKLVITSVANS